MEPSVAKGVNNIQWGSLVFRGVLTIFTIFRGNQTIFSIFRGGRDRHAKMTDPHNPGSWIFLSICGNIPHKSTKKVVFNKNKTAYMLNMMKQIVFY